METLGQYHEIAALALARVFLGLLFFFQGYDVIFNVGLRKATTAYDEGLHNKGIPHFLTTAAAWFTAYTELICGLLLIIGLFHYEAMYLLGINLIVAATGFGLAMPLWDTRHVFPRLILLLILLLVPQEWHHWTLDFLFFRQ